MYEGLYKEADADYAELHFGVTGDSVTPRVGASIVATADAGWADASSDGTDNPTIISFCVALSIVNVAVAPPVFESKL